MIRISSKKDGFRRCGIAHSKQPTDYPDDAFSAEELKALKTEPMLEVEVLEQEPKRLSQNEAIKAARGAETIEALDALAKDEDRPKVLAVIDKRRAELTGAGNDPAAGG